MQQAAADSEKVEILDFSKEELSRELEAALGLAGYRSKQIFKWLYRQRLCTFDAMSDIAKDAREKLAARYSIFRPTLASVQQSVDGTRKYLFNLSDGAQVESVLIAQPRRYTLCISSQVGCAIGCKFCRTALMGLKRNLRTSEIIGQVLAVKDDIARLNQERGTEIDFGNIVFMGMGEPLHNYDNVTRAVKILNDDSGLYFAPRKITVSTSGLVPQIKKLGEDAIPAHLAISLNATTDECRTSLMPINKRYPLTELLATLRDFPATRRHQITIEYVLLRGVNDTTDDLKRLAKLMQGIEAKINLIPYNVNAGLGFDAPLKQTVDHWQRTLIRQGLNTRVRWSKGDDISAACGQLATETAARKKAA